MIANQSSRGPLTDEQRKAMWAKGGGGGRGGRGGSALAKHPGSHTSSGAPASGGSRASTEYDSASHTDGASPERVPGPSTRSRRRPPPPPKKTVPRHTGSAFAAWAFSSGQTPEPVEYLSRMQDDVQSRDTLARALTGFTPIGIGTALQEIKDADSAAGYALAAAAIVLPDGVGKIAPSAGRVVIKAADAAILSKALGRFQEYVSHLGPNKPSATFEYLADITDNELETLQRAVRHLGPEHFGAPEVVMDFKKSIAPYVESAPEARAMLHDFTATPRQLISRQYPSAQAFEEALDSARNYQATHKYQYGAQPLMDLSEKSLNTRLPVKWRHDLIDEDTSAAYLAGKDPYIEIGTHKAFEAAATGNKAELIASGAHEGRHGLQDLKSRSLDKLSSFYDHVPYLEKPWEREVRRAEFRAFAAASNKGKVPTTPAQMARAFSKYGDAVSDDIRKSFDYGKAEPFHQKDLVRNTLGLLSASAIAYGVQQHHPPGPYRNRCADDDAIANTGRREMTDEQRKAMWASKGGGGGGRGGRGGSPSAKHPGSNANGAGTSPSGRGDGGRASEQYDSASHTDAPDAAEAKTPKPKKPNRGQYIPASESTWWSLTKAAASGFTEGLVGGATVLADTFTFGAIDSLSKAADSYQGWEYDVSRTSATVARESLLAAAGIGLASKAGAAYQGTALARSAAGKHMGAIATVGGFGTKSAIDDYREDNPTINPYADKALAMASQLAGYVGSMGLLKSAHQYGGAALRMWPSKKYGSAAGAGKALLRAIDSGLGKIGDKIAARSPAKLNAAVKWGYDKYTSAANFTGSTIKDLGALPSRLSKANRMVERSHYAKNQALAIRQSANATDAALRPRMEQNVQNALDTLRLYPQHTPTHHLNIRTATHNLHTARSRINNLNDALRSSERNAKRLDKAAANLARDAAALKKSAISQAGYVAGGMAARHTADELISDYHERESTKAFRAGEGYDYPMDDPRGPLGTFFAAITGMYGNPIEKQLRPGAFAKLAAVGVYRAKYAMIKEAEKNGELTRDQAQSALEDLAKYKPKSMAGNAIWSFAPAAAAFLNWKVGDAMSESKRTTNQRVSKVHDADTFMTEENPSGIRLQDMNAPEVYNPYKKSPAEPLGDESAAYAQGLVKPGQTIRVIRDSKATDKIYDASGRRIKPHETRPDDGIYDSTGKRLDAYVKADGTTVMKENKGNNGYDKYWRPLGVIETLPRIAGIPFDRLLDIPYFGHLIPGVDINKKIISEGYADIHWRQLSRRQGTGTPDRAEEYDEARAEAQAAKRGIWSDAATQAYAEQASRNPDRKPWIGTEQTVNEYYDQLFKRATGKDRPDAPYAEAMTPLGIGLMTTGNSGVFGMMPRSGNLLAQVYNAVLAVGGALEYNERARRTSPRSARPPKGVMTDYDRRVRSIFER